MSLFQAGKRPLPILVLTSRLTGRSADITSNLSPAVQREERPAYPRGKVRPSIQASTQYGLWTPTCWLGVHRADLGSARSAAVSLGPGRCTS